LEWVVFNIGLKELIIDQLFENIPNYVICCVVNFGHVMQDQVDHSGVFGLYGDVQRRFVLNVFVVLEIVDLHLFVV